jgi:hypothetical protein
VIIIFTCIATRFVVPCDDSIFFDIKLFCFFEQVRYLIKEALKLDDDGGYLMGMLIAEDYEGMQLICKNNSVKALEAID